MKVRSEQPFSVTQTGQPSQVRCFQVPVINTDCSDYFSLIDWQTSQRSESALTLHLSLDFLHVVADGKEELPCYGIPCHTQAVERCIKLVTESSQKVCGFVNREGFIKTCIQSTKIMPVFNTKSQYKAE